MKVTTIQPIDRTHRLIKTSVLLMVTIPLLTVGTAYASHRHHDYNSGTSITFGYIFYPKAPLYHKAYRHPRHHRYYNSHYRGHYGRYNPWRNEHAYKYRRNHYNGYRDDD